MSAYSTAVLADAPNAYWRLGEPSGTTANDSSGNSLNGTYSGCTLAQTSLLPADTDTCVKFASASSSKITVADNALLKPTAISVEAWFKTNSSSQVQQANDFIVGKFNGSTWSQGYGLFGRSSTAKLYFGVNAYNGAGVASVNWSNINDGQKHHIVGTYDGANVIIYIDGTAVQTTPYSTAITHATDALTIGFFTAGSYWSGWLDEVAVYPSALSAARVMAHYIAGIGVSPFVLSQGILRPVAIDDRQLYFD